MQFKIAQVLPLFLGINVKRRWRIKMFWKFTGMDCETWEVKAEIKSAQHYEINYSCMLKRDVVKVTLPDGPSLPVRWSYSATDVENQAVPVLVFVDMSKLAKSKPHWSHLIHWKWWTAADDYGLGLHLTYCTEQSIMLSITCYAVTLLHTNK